MRKTMKRRLGDLEEKTSPWKATLNWQNKKISLNFFFIFCEFLHTLYGIIPGFRDLLRTFSGFFVEQGDTKNPEETSGGRQY